MSVAKRRHRQQQRREQRAEQPDATRRPQHIGDARLRRLERRTGRPRPTNGGER